MTRKNKRPGLKYLHAFNSAGKTYYYFRRGKLRIRLPDDPDSEDFARAYWQARNGKRPHRHGTSSPLGTP